MEKAHHLTAALYFGIAALEAFLNARMRAYLAQSGKSEEETYAVLRKGQITAKLKKVARRTVARPVHAFAWHTCFDWILQ